MMRFWSTTIQRCGMITCCLLIAGCSIPRSIDPRRLFQDDTPAAETAGAAEARERAAAESAAAGGASYPALASVPDRPSPPTAREIRARVLEGLVSDRRNARYTDDAVRAREIAPVPASSSASVSRPASVTIGLAEAKKAAPGSATAVAAVPPPVQVVTPPPAAAVATPAQPAPPITQPEPALASRPDIVQQPPQLPQVAAVQPAQRIPAAPSLTGVAPRETPLATIQFASGSSRLNQADRDILRQAAIIALQDRAAVKVVGHSSASGRGDPVRRRLANLEASIERANAVAAVLVQYGVDPRNVIVEAKSDEEPLYRETAAAGEAGNRRAEIYLLR